MATTGASPDVHSSKLDHWRRLQECLHALNRPGWEGRMQPLAVHMAEKRLVRARSDAGGRGARGGCAARADERAPQESLQGARAGSPR